MKEFLVFMANGENAMIHGDSLYESEGVLKVTRGEMTVAIFADGEWLGAFPLTDAPEKTSWWVSTSNDPQFGKTIIWPK